MATTLRKSLRAITGLAATAVLLAGCTVNESEHSREVETPPTVTMPERVPSDAPAITGPDPGDSVTVKLRSANRDREFILSVPADYRAGERWPIIFAFHGWGENSRVIHNYSRLDDSQAIIAYPQGIDDAWEGAPYAKTREGEDLGFVADILASLRATYSIDDSRIFATGFSNGGGFSALVGCRMNEEFAGVASVGAAYYARIFEECADTPLAMLDIHGTIDPVINYYGGTRHGATYVPVFDVLDHAASRNDCSEQINTTRINDWTLRQDWVGCGHPLSHIRIGGGGHAWPGAEKSTHGYVPENFATDRIREFFGVAAA